MSRDLADRTQTVVFNTTSSNPPLRHVFIQVALICQVSMRRYSILLENKVIWKNLQRKELPVLEYYFEVGLSCNGAAFKEKGSYIGFVLRYGTKDLHF